MRDAIYRYCDTCKRHTEWLCDDNDYYCHPGDMREAAVPAE